MADPATEAIAAAPPVTPGKTGANATAGRIRRRYSLLTGRDKLVLALMVGIPLLLDIALIWGPTLASVGVSLTDWNGIGSPLDAEVVGFRNYEDLFTAYPFFWPALRHNLIWLGWLMLIATPMGIFLAVLLDRQIRGSRF